MTTWQNLLDGYSPYPYLANHASTLIPDYFTARLGNTMYIELMYNLFNLFWFVADVLISSGIVLLVGFALWFIIIDPFLRRIGNLWN